MVTWRSLHCAVDWPPEVADRFLTGTVGPAMAALRDRGAVDDWFFVRYTEGGPHLRIRFRGSGPDLAARVAGELAAGAPAGIHEARYEPEVERYGGPAAIGVAERVFCRSTEVVLARLAGGLAPAGRVAAALDLTLATAVALDLDRLATLRWLRRRSLSSRWHRDAGTPAPVTALGAAPQGPGVARRWRAVAAAAAVGHGPVGSWAAQVRTADAELAGVLGDRHDRLRIWGAQLHMLHNRLGLRPDQEHALGALLAVSLREPDGPTDYFADGMAAADRRYLDASRYLPARAEERAADPAPARAPDGAVWVPRGPGIPLAPRPPRGVPDEVDAGDLGALLWPAGGGPGGAWPAAGLRVAARHVRGLAPGLYEADPVTRTLLPGGPVPPADELAATWSGRWPDPPAVLAIHVRLGALRERYGLRALRLAFLEAGRLAQHLTEGAARQGLRLDPTGEFHDDLAHEVFLLDGVDEVLACLLSLAGRGTSAHPSP
jgi:thiopeptide-type bacteriocin biosynthesis protein